MLLATEVVTESQMIGQFVGLRILGINEPGARFHAFELRPACSSVHPYILCCTYLPVAVDGVIVAGLPVDFNSRSRSNTDTPLVIHSSAGAPFK
jgi:hypothetical protein